MTITIKDLAQMANTSTATVSRVLSNKPGVTEDKRQRILDLAERLGYSPNRIAQNLAMRKSHILGLVAAELRNPAYIEFLHHVQNQLEDKGYKVLIADSELDVEKEQHNIQMMREHQAEGLLIFPVHDWKNEGSIDHFLQLKLQKFPFVLIGCIPGYGFDYVTSEEIATAADLTRHLLKLGHKRIGVVGVENSNRAARERLQGVEEAMSEASLHLNEAFCVQAGEQWMEDLRGLLKRPVNERPTALVMMSDWYVLMAQKLYHELELKIPKDLSIVTFGDGPWLKHLVPPVTSTNERIIDVANSSLNLLMKKLENPNTPSGTELIQQRFRERGSCAAPPEA